MIRWGVLGAGRIAGRFIGDSRFCPGSQTVAIGSRTLEKAQQFAAQHQVPQAYGSYQELVDSPNIDAVYICTPHPWHCEHALLALEAGKHVLCEKPFAMTAQEAQTMASAAQAKGLFLMEAMWTRFLPFAAKVKQVLASGELGTIQSASATFGFECPNDPTDRILSKQLGGGALLDVGVYTVSFAHFLFGTPTAIEAKADFTETGVDASTSASLRFASGLAIQCDCSVVKQLQNSIEIVGSSGSLSIPYFWGADKFSMAAGAETKVIEAPHPKGGFSEEIEEVERCLAQGLKESSVLPLSETVAVMESLDEIRRQIGLEY